MENFINIEEDTENKIKNILSLLKSKKINDILDTGEEKTDKKYLNHNFKYLNWPKIYYELKNIKLNSNKLIYYKIIFNILKKFKSLKKENKHEYKEINNLLEIIEDKALSHINETKLKEKKIKKLEIEENLVKEAIEFYNKN